MTLLRFLSLLTLILLPVFGTVAVNPETGGDLPGHFRPMAGDEDTQAYHLDFVSEDGRIKIFLSMIVSNFGPGDLNNGVSLVLAEEGQPERVWTAGYSHRSLTMSAGSFGVKIGRCRLWREGSSIRLILWLPDPEMSVEFVIEPSMVPLRLTSEPVRVARDGNQYFDASLPVPNGKWSGRLSIKDGRTLALRGRGGIAHIFADHPMYPYARRLKLLRASDEDQGFFLAAFEGSNSARQAHYGILVRTEGNRVVERVFLKRPAAKTRSYVDRETGYRLFRGGQYEFGTAARGTCRIVEDEEYVAARFSVMKHVPYLVGFFLQFTSARPYMVYAEGRVGLECEGDAEVGVSIPSHSSYFLIQP